jgi:hypothetical protein
MRAIHRARNTDAPRLAAGEVRDREAVHLEALKQAESLKSTGT